MAEATNWRKESLPSPPNEPTVVNILVLAGNITHFAGDLGVSIWDYFLNRSGSWDHIILVPGPYDYGNGTVQRGDEYTCILARLSPLFTVLNGGEYSRSSVFFTGPNLLIVGAPCWPTEARVYELARVCERIGEGKAGELVAVGHGLHLTEKTAKQRLAADVSSLKAMLSGDDDTTMTRIVVTYGCPSDTLDSTAEKRGILCRYFKGTVSLGDASVYRFFSDRVDHWIYGASGNRPVQKIGRTEYRTNHYDCEQKAFETVDMIEITKRGQ
jgi:hypothetical protein